MLDELHGYMSGELGPYWALKIGLMAVVIIAGVIYCRHVFAWTQKLEDERAERNERERLKSKGR